MSAITDNAKESRYELEEDGELTIAEYRDGPGARMITHVETPTAARGKGTAKRLMDGVVAEARATGRKIRPRCGYAVAYFQRYPDAADVVE